MRETRLMMGMPITVEITDAWASAEAIGAVFDYFDYVDQKFSPYKDTSELSALNAGRVSLTNASADMRQIFALANRTRLETNGYFEILHDGKLDPTGLVKGWAIHNAARLLQDRGFQNFYVDAGGDIQACGLNARSEPWRVGIRNPFNIHEIVKVLSIRDLGVATSGTYIRGQHIFDPFDAGRPITEIVSLTVIGPNIYEADRFATAAFAMGQDGIGLIERLPDLEGYMIDAGGMGTATSGFGRYVLPC